MSYKSETIAKAIGSINKEYFLPAIQREFVWKPEQIIQLFDSIMRGYPISSFLFWCLKPENRDKWQVYKFLEKAQHGGTHNELANTDGITSLSLVLDGQQRLTSLVIGLRGSYVIKKKYKRWDSPDAMLKPATVIDETTKQEKRIEVLVGFRTAPVFAVETTDGKELPKADDEVIQWINALPLVDVAGAWGLNVEAFNGQNGKALGHYCKEQAIGLGVKNLSTWAHELLHAADHRLGNLTEKGQHWRSETVAELGGAILLECLGYSSESDRGGCWDYVGHYAEDAGLQPIQACMNVLKRTCDAVELILTEAGKISLQHSIEHSAI